MAGHEPPTGPILVGINDTPEARAAAAYAARSAADTPGQTVLLAHAYWVPTNFLDVAGKSMIGQLETKAHNLLDGIAAELRQTYPAPIQTTMPRASRSPTSPTSPAPRRPWSSAKTPRPWSTG